MANPKRTTFVEKSQQLLASTGFQKCMFLSLEVLAMTAAAIGFAWLYFVPQFWYLVSVGSSFMGGIQEIFLSQSDNTQTLGGGVDQLGTVWIFHIVNQIQSGQLGTILPHIFYPIGFDLGQNTGFAWADATLSRPLIHYFGTPGFYNLHILTTLVLSQLSIAFLCRTIGTPFLISIGMGALAICQPFAIAEIYQGRPTQVYWVFHALFLLAVFQLTKGKNPFLWGFLGGLFLTGSCLVYWFGGAAIGFCGAIVLMLELVKPRQRVKMLVGGSILSATTLLTAVALTWRVSGPILKGEGGTLFSAMRKPMKEESILGWNIPVKSITYLQDKADVEALFNSIQIGLPIMLIAILGISLPFGLKRKWNWIIAFLVALTIPMGSQISWPGGGLLTGFAWLHSVFPPLARCTLPHRMIPVAIILGLVIGAMTIRALLRRFPKGRIRNAVSLPIGIALISIAISNTPSQEESRKGRFGPDLELLEATQNWPGGIIDVPLMISERSYIQTVYHKQPILGGPGLISVRPLAHQRYCNRNSLLRRLEAMAEKGKTGGFEEKHRQQLIDDGFSLIVVDLNKSQATADEYQDLLGTRSWLKQQSNRLYIGLE